MQSRHLNQPSGRTPEFRRLSVNTPNIASKIVLAICSSRLMSNNPNDDRGEPLVNSQGRHLRSIERAIADRSAIGHFATMDDISRDQVSADNPDWSRERPRQFWDPPRKLLSVIRKYQYWRAKAGPFAMLICKWLVVRHRFWSVVTGADIPLNSHIGGGLVMLHPNGIVIHPDARIGVNCLIFHQVTIGTRSGAEGVPEIGGHVELGAGVKVLGPVCIGAHAKIGANAVVLSDVPSRMVAVGIPAKVLRDK